MPALPDYLSDWPEVQTLAREVGMSWDELHSHLVAQGIYAESYDRIAPDVVWAALWQEVKAGRGWLPRQQFGFR